MQRKSIRLELEQLEDRLAPATFTVTTSTDNGNNNDPTANSLRAAIIAVNAGKDDTIQFSVNKVNLVASLPNITKPVNLDGSTAPGGNVMIAPAKGNQNAPLGNGLVFVAGAGGSQVLGLSITGFTGQGQTNGKGLVLDDVSSVLIGEKIDPTTEAATYAPVASFGNRIGLEITGANAAANTVVGSFFGTNMSQGGKGNKAEGILIDNQANDNTIGGLASNQINVISGNAGGVGLAIYDANNNIIAGNRIGTNKAGTNALPNQIGVLITRQSSRNQIGARIPPVGGMPPNPANLISGNKDAGVEITDKTATTNFVIGNWIGVDSSGNVALGNAVGIKLSETQGNMIGRTASDKSLANLNVISGNKLLGIQVTGTVAVPSTNNIIQNNNIGIGPDRNKQVAVGNGGDGISFDANSNNNWVKGNVIKNNKPDAIQNAAANKINDPNSIYDNGFGIDDGTTAGAPVLTSAVVSNNTLTVSGSLTSTPSTTFSMEFFGGTDLDPTGSAEGEQWLGTANVTTNSSGYASFQVTLDSIYGTYVTATATDPSTTGGTSDFSNTLTITGESQTATVGGNVWDDANTNGLLDTSESGVASVAVQLFTSTGSLVASTATDSSGNYSFTNVTPGDYYLQFTDPSGYFFTQPYQGDDTVSSQADPTTGQTPQFTLIAGEVDPYYNVGLIPNTLQEPSTTAIASNENPSYSGDQVTFTATVTQTDCVPVGGTVTFMDGSSVLGTVNLTSDAGGYQASFTTTNLSVANHTITAEYNGDGFHTSSSASLTQVVQLPVSVTSITSSSSSASPGQSVTFTVSVTGDGSPTGIVTFYNGSTELGTSTLDGNGNATFTTSTLPSGSNTITATYSGDSNFSSSSGSQTQLITQGITSSTSVSSSLNPASEDQPITITATVSGGSGTPTGSVTFMNGDTVLGTATLDNNGNATFTTSDLLPGSQTITVNYSGDGTYNSNSTSLTQTINSPISLVSLTSNATPALAGAPLTFTAAVTAADSTDTPTGTVTFYDGPTTLGIATLDANGNATFTLSTLSSGSHDIVAIYSGDSNFDDGADSLTQVISQEISSSVSLSSSASTSTPNQAVTFTATVTGNSGTPTGSITLMDGDTILSTATLGANGNATLTTSGLALGSQTITAIYSGDATYGDSSASLTETVEQTTAQMTFMSSNIQSPSGQPVTFSVTVNSAGGSTPTGTVTFLDGTTTLATETLESNGDASYTTSSLSNGIHVITAVYSGDDTYAATSSSLLQTISWSMLMTPSLSLSSSASAPLVGQSVTFTAAVSGGSGTPTGTVTFLDGTTVLDTATLDGNGNATFTTSDLALGSHDIIAIYSGGGTYSGNASSLTPDIVQAASTTSLSSSATSSPVGQPVTFTATITTTTPNAPAPTGTVAFYDGTTLLGTGTLTLVNGQWQATFTTSTLGLGKHDIVAVYSGDGTFADSDSALDETITS